MKLFPATWYTVFPPGPASRVTCGRAAASWWTSSTVARSAASGTSGSLGPEAGGERAHQAGQPGGELRRRPREPRVVAVETSDLLGGMRGLPQPARQQGSRPDKLAGL